MTDFALRNGLLFLEEFRKLNREMNIQTAVVFMHIAMDPGITTKELMDRTGLAQSSVSRNTAALSRTHRLNKPGYDLVTERQDPEDWRRKIYGLTHKGEAVANTLRALMMS